MEDRIWNLPSFECDGVPPAELRQKWIDYKNAFIIISEAIGKKYTAMRWKSIFLAVAGMQLQKIYMMLGGKIGPSEDDDPEEDDDDPFKSMIAKLDAYFTPKKHDTFERHTFHSMAPVEGETFDKFMLRSQVQQKKCNFGQTAKESGDIALVDKMILWAPPDLRKKMLERPSLDVDELARLINSHLSIDQQSKELNKSVLKMNPTMNASYSGATAVCKVGSFKPNRKVENSCGTLLSG